jgi:AraC family transcriptional regulator of adaptative response/methylated-DNA-[protein]-cysteine methyltransferase
MTAKQYRKGDVAVHYAIERLRLRPLPGGGKRAGICAILLGDDDAN